MKELPENFLYHLLPAFHRERDRTLGGPLQALMATLQGEYELIQDNVEDLYDGWFIETCADWMVPYLGELLGLEGFTEGNIHLPSTRRKVADILALRRRKGTRFGLERATALTTGWPAQVTPPNPATQEIPSAEVRLWRLRTFPVRNAMAARLSSGHWTFHPLGVDSPLFNTPRTPRRRGSPLGLENLPVPLLRETLAREIAALRRGERPPTHFFAPPAALSVHDPFTGEPIPPTAIEIVDLSSEPLSTPPTSYEITSPQGNRESRPVRLFLDPERGRFTFPEAGKEERPVWLSSSYGLSDDLGGGPYGGHPACLEPATWQAILGRQAGHSLEGIPVYDEAEGALRAFRSSCRRRGILWLQGDETIELGEDPLEVELKEGQELTIRAMVGSRPAVLGDLRILAPSGRVQIRLEGFWLGGNLLASGAVDLVIRHATLLPGANSEGSLVLQGGEAMAGSPPARASVQIEDCILGPVLHLAGDCALVVQDSILDGGGGAVVLLARPPPANSAPVRSASRLVAQLTRVTLLGPSRFSVLEKARDVLFAEPVEVLFPEQGRVSNSYVPSGSTVPLRQDCIPSSTAEGALEPVFSSRRYGNPAYARLSAKTSAKIRAGSSTGSEIGVFGRLRNVDREAALASTLEEFVPWGVKVQEVFVT